MAMASSMRALKSSSVMVENTSFMAVWQLSIALLDGHADVHVLRPLLLAGELEVPVGALEVEDHQAVSSWRQPRWRWAGRCR